MNQFIKIESINDSKKSIHEEENREEDVIYDINGNENKTIKMDNTKKLKKSY